MVRADVELGRPEAQQTRTECEQPQLHAATGVAPPHGPASCAADFGEVSIAEEERALGRGSDDRVFRAHALIRMDDAVVPAHLRRSPAFKLALHGARDRLFARGTRARVLRAAPATAREWSSLPARG